MHSRPCPDRFKAAVDHTSKSLISICAHINNGGFDGTYLLARSNGVRSPGPTAACPEYLFADRAFGRLSSITFHSKSEVGAQSPRFSQRNNSKSILKTERRYSNVFQR